MSRCGRAPTRWRNALAASGLLFASLGCGSSVSVAEAPRTARAEGAAVGKMIRAVAQAERPAARTEAVALLRQAVAEDPDLWEARFNLGVLLAQQGELGPARLQLARAHELAPNAEDVVTALAEVLRRLDELPRARAVLADFVGRYPDASQAGLILVFVLRESGELELALERARALLKQQPGDAAALAELALTHLARAEVEVAELLIQQALQIEPRGAVVERAAGLIALGRGEDALAFSHFARATGLDPNDTAAGLNTGTVLLQAGVYPRAEKHFRAVLEVDPESDAAKLGLAAALRGQGRRDDPEPYRAAELLLREIVVALPEHWAATHNLAVLYAESMDRPLEATAQFTRFLSIAPASHPARARAQKWVDEHSAAKQDPSTQVPH